MTRQERSWRLVYHDGTVSRAMTRDEAEAAFLSGPVAEVVHVVRRKSGVSAILPAVVLKRRSVNGGRHTNGARAAAHVDRVYNG